MRPAVLALLFLSALAMTSAHAAAGDVRRCTGPDGGVIFTDHKCEDLGATDRLAPAAAGAPPATSHLGTRGCARTIGELRTGIEGALAARDVNRLAGFYHWPGITNEGSATILKRLQAIADRPLLALQVVRSHGPRDASGFETVATGESPDGFAEAIELVQAHSAGDPTSVRTTLGITRYLGCAWVRF